MQEYLVVDGYNIIGAWPHLKALKDRNLEEARDALVHTLAEYQSFSGMKTYLVFDAYQVPGLGKAYTHSKLAVLYTKEKETADELIERLVTGLIGRRKQVYVATSDMIEQHVIFGHGALRLSASELWTKVKLSRKEIQGKLGDIRASGRNTFDNNLDERTREWFERLRRGK